MELKHFKQKFEDKFHPAYESLVSYLMLHLVGTEENIKNSRRIEVKGSGEMVYDRGINMFADTKHLEYIDKYLPYITKMYCKPLDNVEVVGFPTRLIDYNTLVLYIVHPYDKVYTEEELTGVENPFRLDYSGNPTEE